MDSLEIRLSSTPNLIKEKKNIQGYINTWEDTLKEIETELRNREQDYACY